MHYSILLISFVLSIVTNPSCKKELVKLNHNSAGNSSQNSLIGTWDGFYSVETMQDQGKLFYSITINPDGSLITEGEGGDGILYNSYGHWRQSKEKMFIGTIISTFPDSEATGISQTISFPCLDSLTLYEGIWNDTNNPYGSKLKGKLFGFKKREIFPAELSDKYTYVIAKH